VQDAGYDLILNIKNNSEESNQLHEASLNRIRQNTIWSGVFAIPIMVIGMFLWICPMVIISCGF